MSESALEAVKKAAEELGAPDEKEETQVEQQTETTETDSEEDEESSEEDNDDLDPEESKKAMRLWNMLKDRDVGPGVIKRMAINAGLLEAETKKEVRTAERKFETAIKEALGEEYSFLSDKLAGPIQALADELRGEFQNALTAQEQQRVAVETERMTTEFIDAEKVTEAELNIMNKISARMPPNPQTPLKVYLRDILTLARNEQTKIAGKVKTATKIAKNLQGKSTTKGVEGSEIKVIKRPANPSARDAVMAALRGETFED